MNQPLDRDGVWSAAKMAIHAYEEDPSTTNAKLVKAAVRSIRKINEVSTDAAGERHGLMVIPRSSLR